MFRLNPDLALRKTRNPNKNNNSGVRPNSCSSPSKNVRNIQIRVFRLNSNPDLTPQKKQDPGPTHRMIRSSLPGAGTATPTVLQPIRQLNSSFFSAESYLRVECTPEKKRDRIYTYIIYIYKRYIYIYMIVYTLHVCLFA